MKILTSAGVPIESDLLRKYFQKLVNQFFKILPMREKEEPTLRVYMKSLQLELFGFQELVDGMERSASYLSLLSILQYLIDHPNCDVESVRREVFKSIAICNQLEDCCAHSCVEDGDCK